MAESHIDPKEDPFEDERRELVAHILGCDVCLAVVADCRRPTTECVERCPTYRKLLEQMESARQKADG